jgi:hypothetical protein
VDENHREMDKVVRHAVFFFHFTGRGSFFI